MSGPSQNISSESSPTTPSHSQSVELYETNSSSSPSLVDDLHKHTRPSFNLRKRNTDTSGGDGAAEDGDSESMAVHTSDDDDDQHEEDCTVCHRDNRPDKLLCCDNCPRVYHLDCLTPPLARVPKGLWQCPYCTDLLKLKDIGVILAEKDGMYHVKWKGKSYLHCSWIDKSMFDAAKKLFTYLQSKLRAFETKQLEETEAEAYDPREFTDGLNRNWTAIDKIVDAKDSSHRVFLVKWKELAYDQCTWEKVEDLKDATEHINAYKKQMPIKRVARTRARAKRDNEAVLNSPVPRENTRGERFTETPPFLRRGCQLHPYQLEGLSWLKFKWDQQENVILADEMGLGKTIQAIAFMAALWDDGVSLPHLIVVPLSTVKNWLREFEVWAPQLVVIAVTGNKSSRETILKHELYVSRHLRTRKRRAGGRNESKHVKCHAIITSYETVALAASKLGKLEYECLIVDEGHRLKTKGSKLVKELNAFNCRHRILLTGTPLQNNIQELFALLHFLDGRKFDSWEKFEADFAEISEEEQVNKLHHLLSPHLLRRLKKDVLKTLPPKKEQIVRVEMTEDQREMYKAILAQNFHLLVNDKSAKQTRQGLMSVMMDLRKCCGHPYLFDGVEQMDLDKKSELEHLINISGKLQLLDILLARLKQRGHRVLIYSQFCIILNILEDYLELKKYGFLRIDGAVNGDDRQTMIDAFNCDRDKYFVFLLSTRAGGLGINLSTADTVILYDSDFNPHNDIQAQARAHRLGQDRPVMIYRLVTRLTVEERMMQLAKKKLVLEQIVVRKMGNEELKQDELDGILRYGAAELFADERLSDKAGHGSTLREQETERLTAESNAARIVYDEEMIEKLLDRSNMTTVEDDSVDNELLGNFKIANFEVSDLLANGQNTWKAILGHRKEVQEMTKKEKLDVVMTTPGRRRRRNEVVYNVEDAETGDSNDSEYNAEGQEPEESSESTDLEPDLDVNVTPTKAAPPKPSTSQQPQRPPPAESERLTFRDGSELLIMGFATRERQLFLNLLLRYGFPEESDNGIGPLDWTEFANRFPRKKHQFIDAYARVLMAAAQGERPSGVKQEEMLFDCNPQHLLSKIGMMHILKRKLDSVSGSSPARLWSSSMDTKCLYDQTHYWKEPHDLALITAVVRFGHGRWKEFLSNGPHDLESTLYQELSVPFQISDGAIDLSISPDGHSHDTPMTDGRRQNQERSEDDAARKKARLRSAEAKCRNWMADRLKKLVDCISNETEILTRNRQALQIVPTQLATTNLVVTGSLKWRYQAILRQCFAVRECSNLVSGNQSYEELQAAGAQFRQQMKELAEMARNLRESLPDIQESSSQQESEVKNGELPTPVSSGLTSAVRLDTTLGTNAPPQGTPTGNAP